LLFRIKIRPRKEGGGGKKRGKSSTPPRKEDALLVITTNWKKKESTRGKGRSRCLFTSCERGGEKRKGSYLSKAENTLGRTMTRNEGRNLYFAGGKGGKGGGGDHFLIQHNHQEKGSAVFLPSKACKKKKARGPCLFDRVKEGRGGKPLLKSRCVC